MSDTIRRVYALPKEMVSAIQAFAKDELHLSEVDAVRRLLKVGLEQFETEDALVARLEAMKPVDAGFAACGHPLVDSIGRVSEREANFTLASGRQLKVVKS